MSKTKIKLYECQHSLKLYAWLIQLSQFHCKYICTSSLMRVTKKRNTFHIYAGYRKWQLTIWYFESKSLLNFWKECIAMSTNMANCFIVFIMSSDSTLSVYSGSSVMWRYANKITHLCNVYICKQTNVNRYI